MNGLVVEPGDVTVLTVDRPAARNAIDRATLTAFEAAVDALVVAPPRVVILAGTGGSFVSGADIKDFQGLGDPVEGREMSARMHRALARFAALPCPSIAALDGDAHGGGWELAVACDLRVVAHGARFVFRQVAMGLVPGWGGGQRLVGLVGRARALDWLVRAAVVGADEALRAGLAEHVAAPPDTALGLARTLGAQIVALPPRAVAAAKRVVGGVAPAALTAEAEVFAELWGGVDHRLAVDRFLARPRG